MANYRNRKLLDLAHRVEHCQHCGRGDEAEGSKRLAASLIQELRNIAEARRYDRKHFADDGEFADWAQSRCRFAIDRARAEGKE